MNKFEFNFQNLADVWTKNQLKNVSRQAKYAYLKGNRWSKKLIKRNWHNDWENLGQFYFANRAIVAGASHNLPFKTLSLLGELLTQDTFKDEINQIIKENVLKFEGHYFKLDDPENQNKIRKALRTYKFQKADKFAA